MSFVDEHFRERDCQILVLSINDMASRNVLLPPLGEHAQPRHSCGVSCWLPATVTFNSHGCQTYISHNDKLHNPCLLFAWVYNNIHCTKFRGSVFYVYFSALPDRLK